ncbi:MAG: hypothetical protein SGI97_00655 [candidate division Zixibacteria bacterium]|nr:hypothetical protein [candidate division Zixibacteria bacterium]
MKHRNLMTLAVLLTALSVVGCNKDETVLAESDPVPATPQGVYSVTGDLEVAVKWNGIYEADVKQYIVWRSIDSVDNYLEIGRIAAISNPNQDLLIYTFVDDNVSNGATYYYAVSAVDFANQISDLSAEDVFDTPRPEGSNRLYSLFVDSTRTGFNLSAGAPGPANAAGVDIFIDDFEGLFYINAADIDTDIQDMGYTNGFDEIGYATDTGWSELGYSELIAGHTYLVWTRDNHFAKIRITATNFAVGWVDIHWAYQTDPGNLELSLPHGFEKPQHDQNYLKSKAAPLLRTALE